MMNDRYITRGLKSFTLVTAVFALAGCAAMKTSIEKRDLDVQTKMSETIFLEPVSPDKRIVFFSLRNTTDKDVNIKSRIAASLAGSGYQITNDPEKATFMLQANLLKLGRDNLDSADSYIEAGYSGAVVGNAFSGRHSGNNSENAVLGALVGLIADSMVQDIQFTMVTDIQIRERPLENESVSQKQKASISQGSSTSVTQSSSTQVQWKTYRTRVVSTANQVNLEFADAAPALEKGLIRSISGLFAE